MINLRFGSTQFTYEVRGEGPILLPSLTHRGKSILPSQIKVLWSYNRTSGWALSSVRIIGHVIKNNGEPSQIETGRTAYSGGQWVEGVPQTIRDKVLLNPPGDEEV